MKRCVWDVAFSALFHMNTIDTFINNRERHPWRQRQQQLVLLRTLPAWLILKSYFQNTSGTATCTSNCKRANLFYLPLCLSINSSQPREQEWFLSNIIKISVIVAIVSTSKTIILGAHAAECNDYMQIVGLFCLFRSCVDREDANYATMNVDSFDTVLVNFKAFAKQWDSSKAFFFSSPLNSFGRQ